MRVPYFMLSAALLGLHAHAQQIAHFHHVHLNSVNPEAAIEFYTKHFNSEAGKFAGSMNAVWTQKSWLLFNKVAHAPPSAVVSSLYHIGWGAEDMKTEYQ